MQNMLMFDDTIAAISTPLGEGGIGIVRLSGPDAYSLVGEIFYPKNPGETYPTSHRIYYGHLQERKHQILDEVLVTFMRAPRTYTREDVVEINCHSGPLILQMILKAVLNQGARMAEPGEFTKRAFINGRIDLSQAESVMNIIRAKSEKAVNAAASVLEGKLAEEIQELKGRLTESRAHIEAFLDFPEDDVEEVNYWEWLTETKEIINRVSYLCRGAKKGVIFQEGLNLSIVGKVNVGKSSLLNRLLQKQRAIVTEIPGTTRDTLEELIELGGIPVRLVDTAGIRKTEDPVERLGVDRALDAADSSHLVLLMLDGIQGMDREDREIIEKLKQKEKETWVAVNKVDQENIITWEDMEAWIPGAKTFKISAKTGEGIDQLEESLAEWVENLEEGKEGPLMLVSERHQQALEEAYETLSEVHQLLQEEGPLDIISMEVYRAESKLGEIIGENADEDLLEYVFQNFCIGK